ncbi:MAG: mechanosensitive ion channel family protein, partial [Myxococcales bacterium]|nr:mechanosensitive ion channel family protein [Myxococcales bacterium]
ADPAAAASEAPEPQPVVPYDELDRGSPRGSALGYLLACREGDYERAAAYLDLRRIDPGARAERGPKLARQLKVVLDRTLWVPVDDLSESAEGLVDDGLPADMDRIGVIETGARDVEIDLERVEGEDGTPVWLFSAATVAAVPKLHQEFGYGPLHRYLPAVFFEVRALEVLLWQWIALLALVVAAWMLSYLCAAGIVAALRPLVARTETDLDDRLFDATLPPLRLISAVFVFWLGSLPLGLAVPAREFLGAIERGLVLIAVTWLVIRFVDVISEIIEQRLERRGQETAVPLVAPGRKTVKGVVFLVTFVAILDNFGFNVTALVAGLGVGGIAVALAAQKSIENLFGGIMLYADRPVRVGDFCKFAGQVGTVEEVGMRSTRVRTLDRTVVTVPNAEFSNLHLENFAERDFIRLHTVLGLRYETTPEQLRHLLVELRKLLYAHPKISNDPARVRFVSFGAYSLDVEITAYAATSDWAEFLGIREDFFLAAMDRVEASGTGFAFPSQTLYLAQDGGTDEEQARAAEAEVKAWRERDALLLPDFPESTIQELEGAHPWPPEGSPGRARG